MVTEQTGYGFGVKVRRPCAEALAKTKDALKEQGFGVLTEIDVAATLKQKLGKDLRPYTILGVCNPSLAYQGLQAEQHLGLLLPCNVVVFEEEDGGSVVEIADPEAMMEITGNPALEPLAREAKRLLTAAVERIAA